MGFDVTGKLILKSDTVQRSATLKTREFVIETNEDINGRIITNYIKFQVVQDRTSLLDKYNIGDTLKVHFNIRGTKWEKNGQINYITNLDAWRLESISLQPSSPGEEMPAFEQGMSSSSQEVDDLPF